MSEAAPPAAVSLRLVAQNLEAERGGRVLFSGLSFTLSPGQALLLRGPNGSGKSTLLRLLAGLLAPAHGTVALEGGRLAADAHYLSTANSMKPALTVAENLCFWRDTLAGARDADPSPRSLSVPDALDRVGLAHAQRLPFGVLSTGQRRRVGLARLLVDARPLWLLDEPASGLDAASQTRLSALMSDHLGAGGLLCAAVHDDPRLPGAAELVLGAPASRPADPVA